MAQLRGPEGCPWDREQTHSSLRPYLLEEAYETLEALDAGDAAALRDELGDLLLQIVFHAQVAADAGEFAIDDVCRAISDKLIRRHPHVFGTDDADAGSGSVTVADAAGVLPVWEARKRAEREARGDTSVPSRLDGVPTALPALARAYDLQSKAARVGFDWPSQQDRLAKIEEELAELDEALQDSAGAADADGRRDRIEAEFGDLLFMIVNVGRGLGLRAEDALRSACAKFERRFRAMEAAAGGPEAFAALDLAAQDALWNRVKAAEPERAADASTHTEPYEP